MPCRRKTHWTYTPPTDLPPPDLVEYHPPPEGEVMSAVTRLRAAEALAFPELAKAACAGRALLSERASRRLVRMMDRVARALDCVGRRGRRQRRNGHA